MNVPYTGTGTARLSRYLRPGARHREAVPQKLAE